MIKDAAIEKYSLSEKIHQVLEQIKKLESKSGNKWSSLSPNIDINKNQYKLKASIQSISNYPSMPPFKGGFLYVLLLNDSPFVSCSLRSKALPFSLSPNWMLFYLVRMKLLFYLVYWYLLQVGWRLNTKFSLFPYHCFVSCDVIFPKTKIPNTLIALFVKVFTIISENLPFSSWICEFLPLGSKRWVWGFWSALISSFRDICSGFRSTVGYTSFKS